MEMVREAAISVLRPEGARAPLELESQSDPVRLTRKEHELLDFLAQNAGEVVPRQELLAQVWGYSSEARTRTLDVHIRRLRRKLKDFRGAYIETVFGVGYRLQPRHGARFAQPLRAGSAA